MSRTLITLYGPRYIPGLNVANLSHVFSAWLSSRTQGAGLGEGTIFLAEKGKGTYMLPLHGPA